mgnify:CR=1 FL=1
MVVKYIRAASLDEADRVLESDKRARILAGGTQLLTSEFRDFPFVAVDAGPLLPRGLERSPDGLVRIGAGATFQDLADSAVTPRILSDAARGMANRNVRNAATVGGNLGAARSCSSLVPALLVLDARVRIHGAAETRPLEDWLAAPSGIVTYVEIPAAPGLRSAYARWSRTACDLSVLTCAASYRLQDGSLRDLRIACGGLDAKSRRFPELERLFEGRPLPGRDEAAAQIAPALKPIDDLRGSAAFKRLRASELAAEALLAAREVSR